MSVAGSVGDCIDFTSLTTPDCLTIKTITQNMEVKIMTNDQFIHGEPSLFESQRRQMVEYQIRDRGIKDKQVLAAMSKVPRHQFVDSSWRELAYSDRPLPINYSQTISQPYIVAYMTEAAKISPEDTVLEIGTGCGYQVAILGEIAKQVYSIERIPELAQKARQNLSQLGYDNKLQIFCNHKKGAVVYSGETKGQKHNTNYLLWNH